MEVYTAQDELSEANLQLFEITDMMQSPGFDADNDGEQLQALVVKSKAKVAAANAGLVIAEGALEAKQVANALAAEGRDEQVDADGSTATNTSPPVSSNSDTMMTVVVGVICVVLGMLLGMCIGRPGCLRGARSGRGSAEQANVAAQQLNAPAVVQNNAFVGTNGMRGDAMHVHRGHSNQPPPARHPQEGAYQSDPTKLNEGYDC
jgi:hypothetical protein